MRASALAALRRIGEDAQIPPNGTGPSGAPEGGGRWITRDDVLVWNCAVTTIPTAARGGYAHILHSRAYNAVPNALRDYQRDAVLACNPAPDTFRSCIVNMECGTGKTWVASELLRRSGARGVVVTLYEVAVTEFVTHLVTTLGMRAVALQRDDTTDLDEYDVVVTTYNRVVRVAAAVDAHRECLLSKRHAPSHYAAADRLLMQRMCEPFGLLVLDEAHAVVAERFLCACRLRAHVVVGMSGSLIREDNRLSSLTSAVGPVVYTYGNGEREHEVRVHRIPMDDARVIGATTRTAVHQTIRALNPRKVERLMLILREHADRRVIVFCDSVRPTQILHATVLGGGRSVLLNGGIASREVREATIRTFSESAPGSLVLLCTRVCDASIDFPVGCVLVEYHLTSGSRQQEVQRCGRGTRGAEGALLHHVVNRGTEEERFSEWRIAHLTGEMWGSVRVAECGVSSDEEPAALASPSSAHPLDALARVRIDMGAAFRRGANHNRLRNGRLLLKRHGT